MPTVLQPFADDVQAAGAQLLWVGPLAVRDQTVSPILAELGRRFEAFAATDPNVTYLDANSLVAGPDGGFAEVVDGPTGSERVRWAGGLHLCPDGSDRIAAAALAWIGEIWPVRIAADWVTGGWRTGVFSGAEVCPDP